LTPTRTSLGLGWSRISWSRDIAAGVSVSAALRGLNANLGCFTAEVGVAAADEEEDVVVCGDEDEDGDDDDD
jgi:hypothetical protein